MNKAFLIGNLTRDPELRTTTNGIPVCSFGLAVNRRRKVEGQPDVDFFNVTAWRGLGENVAKYMTKGRKVCVVGAIQIRTYDASDGTKKTIVEIEADDVEFMPSTGQAGEGGGGGQYTPHPGMPAAPSGGMVMGTGFAQVDEDELPF